MSKHKNSENCLVRESIFIALMKLKSINSFGIDETSHWLKYF